MLSDFTETMANPEVLWHRVGCRQAIEMVFDSLSEREAFILRKRFGLNGSRIEMTLKEVGELEGVTGGRVRQIEAKALRKIRHPLRARHLILYLSEIDRSAFSLFDEWENRGVARKKRETEDADLKLEADYVEQLRDEVLHFRDPFSPTSGRARSLYKICVTYRMGETSRLDFFIRVMRRIREYEKTRHLAPEPLGCFLYQGSIDKRRYRFWGNHYEKPELKEHVDDIGLRRFVERKNGK